MARLYGVLRPGKGKIDVYLRDHSAKQLILPKWIEVGEIMPVNIIPALMVPKPTGLGADEKKVTVKKETERQKEMLDKIDLTGLEEWGGSEQEEA